MIKTRPSIICLLFIGSVLFSFLLGEFILRCCGHTDRNGDFLVGTMRCFPYQLSLRNLRSRLEKTSPNYPNYIRYDPQLGWAPKENFISNSGLYSFNFDGIRAGSKDFIISKAPPPGSVRIALFGDSFTMGYDVEFSQTWGYYLENALNDHGVKAEVLNFGVGGYGMDQAFLRYEGIGKKFHPHIVIFGLQLENIYRNGNMFRGFYAYYDLLLSKPRFIKENNQLKLINSPPPTPDQIEQIINYFPGWKYAKYESWYLPEAYKDNVLFKSRLFSFLYTLIHKRNNETKIKNQKLIDISLDTILLFKKRVEESGGRFYVVYLPIQQELKTMKTGHQTKRQRLLNLLKDSGINVLDPREEILAEIRKTTFKAVIPWHYSPSTNKIVSEFIVRHIMEDIL